LCIESNLFSVCSQLDLPHVLDKMRVELSQADLDGICAVDAPLIKMTLDKCLGEAKLAKTDVNAIILAGGSCNLRSVPTLVHQFFGKAPLSSIPPETVRLPRERDSLFVCACQVAATGAAFMAKEIIGEKLVDQEFKDGCSCS
jgi:hypothetical protein